jgi:5-methylcytosine-specific restriction endonuclease McrA
MRTQMDREWLITQYIVLCKSTTDIAEEINKDPSTIAYWLRKLKIPRRKVGTMSQQRIQRNRVEVACQYCGKSFLKSFARAQRRERHFCTRECSEKWYTGENSPNYKGFRVDQTGRVSYEYRKWRNEVVARDNHTCQNCGSKEKLHVHHIYRYADYEDLRADIDNGITLCQRCHHEAHKKDEEIV